MYGRRTSTSWNFRGFRPIIHGERETSFFFFFLVRAQTDDTEEWSHNFCPAHIQRYNIIPSARTLLGPRSSGGETFESPWITRPMNYSFPDTKTHEIPSIIVPCVCVCTSAHERLPCATNSPTTTTVTPRPPAFQRRTRDVQRCV